MCRAAATGTRVLGMDIDAAGLIALARMGAPCLRKRAPNWRPSWIVRMNLV